MWIPIGKVALALWLIISPVKQVEIVHYYAQVYCEKVGCYRAEIMLNFDETEVVFLARCIGKEG